MVGKYTQHGDAYISVNEALKSAGFENNVKVEVMAIDSEKLEPVRQTQGGVDKNGEWEKLKSADGILIPGGFGKRGIEGKILAAKYARENEIPYLGLCLGMQILTIEFARKILKTKDVNSEEFNDKTKNPVIHFIKEQKKKIDEKDYGASMRLGAYDAKLNPGSLAFKAYKQEKISERHRHRYEFNNKYKNILSKNGLRIAGINPKKDLVEIVEIEDHPFMVGVQFHPEFKSRPFRAHPLFNLFIKNAIKK
jgi:CTP synthase